MKTTQKPQKQDNIVVFDINEEQRKAEEQEKRRLKNLEARIKSEELIAKMMREEKEE